MQENISKFIRCIVAAPSQRDKKSVLEDEVLGRGDTEQTRIPNTTNLIFYIGKCCGKVSE